MHTYKEKDFDLPVMDGLSQKQIDEHLNLYAGYVKNVNAMLQKLEEYRTDSEIHKIALSELTRRFPFEWNGMRMHELYFESLGGDGEYVGNIAKKIEKQFGSIDNWLAEFKAIGMMRGIGWVSLIHDPLTDTLLNIWVNDHEVGHLAGVDILITMDVWEHAYLIDYLPSQRGEYIDVFLKNLKWDRVEERFINSQNK